jgi:diguanylate cyclase (GGDEF)-like protein/PAS domain S-box-containing protein
MYSLPVIAVGVATALLGFYVYSAERASRIGGRYLLFSLSVALYLVGAGVSYAATVSALSLTWDRIAHIGVSFIPATLLWATTGILGRSRGDRVGNAVALVLSLLSALLVLTSDLFITGNERLFWAYYPQYGVAGYLFVLYFAVVMTVVLFRYTTHIRRTEDELLRRRLNLTRLAIGIGLLGGIDFLPALGLRIYAFGYIPIFIFLSVMAGAIVRYRLVDITPELAAPTILQTMDSAVVVVDPAGVVRHCNSAARDILGLSESEVLDPSVSAALPSLEDAALGRPVEREWISPDGRARTLSIAVSSLRHSSGRLLGTIYVAHDISERKRIEEELQRLALHDVLTGLPNRALFFDRVSLLISRAERLSQRLALLFVDLDGFKGINDTRGHEVGDAVLRTAATRMLSAVRSSDTVARIGGDEFVIICPDVSDPADTERVVRKVYEALETPIRIAGDTVSVGATVGVAHYPEDGVLPETLLSVADREMYARKNNRAPR